MKISKAIENVLKSKQNSNPVLPPPKMPQKLAFIMNKEKKHNYDLKGSQRAGANLLIHP